METCVIQQQWPLLANLRRSIEGPWKESLPVLLRGWWSLHGGLVRSCEMGKSWWHLRAPSSGAEVSLMGNQGYVGYSQMDSCAPSGSQRLEMGRKFTLTTEVGFSGHGGGDLHFTFTLASSSLECTTYLHLLCVTSRDSRSRAALYFCKGMKGTK